MSENNIVCPYCNKEINYADIMGDSDWDDQGFISFEEECYNCGKYIKITQTDIEVTRYFEVEKVI